MQPDFDELELDAITPAHLKRYLRDKFIIVASNRGPVEFREEADGQIRPRRGAGGVVTAMSTALTATDAVWLSAARTPQDRAKAAAAKRGRIPMPQDNPQYWVKFVTPEPAEFDGYYNVISNELLWYMQHYLWDVARTPVIDDSIYNAWNDGYRRVNRRFADAILDEIAKTDKQPLVFLQDYHLYLCAHYIRRKAPNVFIHHFTHSPWTQPDYLRLLPLRLRRELMQGILANDIVGFHTSRYVSNFIWCCQEGDAVRVAVNPKNRSVNYEGRQVLVRHYPISIDQERLVRRAQSADVQASRAALAELVGDRRLLLRVDRIELSKNVIRGLAAYRMMLRDHPEWHDRVVFACLLYPSREDLAEYREYRKEIEAMASSINDEFGTAGWKPLYLDIKDDYPRALAALLDFDVLLVNPVFDGMNLVAKEGAAVNQRDGVVLLSVNAGAYSEMRDHVIPINPLDVVETADAIHRALAMPAKARQKMSQGAKAVVHENTSFKWLMRQIQNMRRVERARRPAAAERQPDPSYLRLL